MLFVRNQFQLQSVFDDFFFVLVIIQKVAVLKVILIICGFNLFFNLSSTSIIKCCDNYFSHHFGFVDFSSLFPDRNIMEGNFTVITVSQQTENDMATWNTNVSNERKQLLASVSFFPIFSLILNYIYIFFLYSSLQGPGGAWQVTQGREFNLCR